MEQDDDDPLEPSRLPTAGDRIWLHPSEFAPLLSAPADPKGDHPSRHKRASRPVVALSVLSGTIGAVLPLGVLGLAGGFGPSRTNRVYERVADLSATNLAGSDGVSQLADAVAPAVVAVQVATPAGTRFGSGVIFRSDGRVLTSSHLVESAMSIQLTCPDGRSWPARQTGSDPESDLAVLSPSDNVAIAPAVLGSAEGLRVGQAAVALGAPASPQGTPSVTVGVISGIGETTKAADHPLYDMIATDATIPPRASGGPLVDRSGAVVGIVVQETNEDHLGLVVPIDRARRVAEQLIASGRMTYPWLGLSGSDLDPGTAAESGAKKGALIRHVTPRSPADRSGLKVEDVVTSADGRPITTMDELMMLVRRHEPDDVVELTIARSGLTRKVKVRLSPTPSRATGAEKGVIP